MPSRRGCPLRTDLTLFRSFALFVSSVSAGVAPSNGVAQSARQVADGVHVYTLPERGDQPAQNIGWIEFADHLLLVDGAGAWATVGGRVAAPAAKPARFVVATVGATEDGSGPAVPGLTRFAADGADTRLSSGGTVDLDAPVELRDGAQRVRIIPVVADDIDGAGAIVVFVPDAGVLFVGDLVGRGREADPLPASVWIGALQGLERLGAQVVVPGRGDVGGPELLQRARARLEDTRSAIATAVEAGRTREEVVSTIVLADDGILPAGTVRRLYDEMVGLRPAAAFVQRLGLRPGPAQAGVGRVQPSKVVVADFWPGQTERLARVAPGVQVIVVRSPDEAVEAVEDADAILGWITPEIFARARKLRWVQLPSAGVERYLAIPGFVESDVVLTNAQRLFAQGGAEHVLGMTLALARRLPTALTLQRERRWDVTPLTGANPYSGAGSELMELRGRTMLVVGLGGIGTEVARAAHGLGMRVIATRGSRRDGPPFVDYVGLSSELLSLTPDADVIVNAVPLTPVTEKMFDDRFFRATKPTAFFVNIGRGGTVDTDALVRALREGRIAGAGLDVTDPEPLPTEHELWGMPNVIITPHVGGDSDRHMERIWLLFRENLRRFVNGEALLSVVDKRRGY